jgi:hypothetical protein
MRNAYTNFVGKHKGKRALARLRLHRRLILKMIVKKYSGRGLDSFGSG